MEADKTVEAIVVDALRGTRVPKADRTSIAHDIVNTIRNNGIKLSFDYPDRSSSLRQQKVGRDE